MAETTRHGSVSVGEYSLEVESGSGSFAQYEPNDERTNRSALATALDAERDERPKPVAAIEEFQESAESVTGKIERADQLLKAAADGRLLDINNVSGEIDSLLDLFGRLDRAGRFEEELRLMRSLNGLLALALRWLDLIRSLRSLLSSAETAQHAAGRAFAEHELGSLYLCAGRPDKAVEHLERADRLEKALTDLGGRCATRHNLDSAERDLALLRSGGSQRPTKLQRILVLAGAIAVAAAGGAGIALAVHHRHNHTSTTTSPQPGAHTVAVLLAGSGNGSVQGLGLACGTDCSTSVADGHTITLIANHASGSAFTGWSGVDHCGAAETCTLRVHSGVTVTATFTSQTPTQTQTQTQTQPEVVPAPTGLSVVAVSPTAIDISWRDPPAVGYFVIYRGSQMLAPVFGNTTSYHDTNLAPSTTYKYRVQALASDGKASAKTPQKSATTPPSSPSNLVVTESFASSTTEMDLTWTPPTSDTHVTGYIIYRVEYNGAPPDTLATPDTPLATVGNVTGYPNLPNAPVATSGPFASYADSNNISYGATYGYVVKAVDAVGKSSQPSNLAWATEAGG